MLCFVPFAFVPLDVEVLAALVDDNGGVFVASGCCSLVEIILHGSSSMDRRRNRGIGRTVGRVILGAGARRSTRLVVMPKG